MERKCALVTGAAKGIGRAIARALAEDGFSIALHYRSSEEAARRLASELESGGSEVSLLQADLSRPDEAEELVKRAEKVLGPLHTLVANAGLIQTNLLAFTPLELWRQIQAVNLDAPFLLTKTASRIMARRRNGRIIYIASDAALMGDLMRGAYSASKAGLLGLCKSAARELAPSRITVNAVAPGVIESDMTADLPPTRRRKQLEAIPMGRFGRPEEVAGVVRFLASGEASWITGQTLSVDGGMNMRP